MEEKITVLVVDDEYKITEALSAYLACKGHEVVCCDTGAEALRIFSEREIGFIILDLMLPDVTGEEVCAEIRKKSSVPVIMLTAKSGEEDVLAGLGVGADDYVVKPFSIKQLYARMEAVLRRSSQSGAAGDKLSFGAGDLEINFRAMEVKKGGEEVALTAAEWKILSVLVKNRGMVFTRERLIECAFGDEFDGYDRAIDTHVKNLRRKIESDRARPEYILTVRGSGYKFGGKN